MNRPEKTQVGPFAYTIEYVPEPFRANEDCVELLLGQVRHDPQVIRVTDTVASDKLRCIVLHETLHAIDEVYNNGKVTEESIKPLTTGLFAWLRANPEFVAWLMESEG